MTDLGHMGELTIASRAAFVSTSSGNACALHAKTKLQQIYLRPRASGKYRVRFLWSALSVLRIFVFRNRALVMFMKTLPSFSLVNGSIREGPTLM